MPKTGGDKRQNNEKREGEGNEKEEKWWIGVDRGEEGWRRRVGWRRLGVGTTDPELLTVG